MEPSGLGGWGCKLRGWGRKCKNFRNFLEVTKNIPQIAGDERPLPPVLCACTLLWCERSEA